MKRLWLGAGILIALLAVSLWIMADAESRSERVCDSLGQVMEAARDEDWAAVEQGTADTQKLWEESWDGWAALSDHTILDEIDAGFARLEVYGRDRHETDFAAECAALIRRIEALGEGHRLNWRNLM